MTTDRGNFPMNPDPFSPTAEPPKKERGCFFYGCLVAIILAVLALIVVSVGGYFGYRAFLGLVNEYTSTTPVTLPKVEMSEEDHKALRERIDAFKKALDEGADAEPLVLTGDELNAALAENPEVAGRVYFIIEGDKLKGQVSMPLDALPLPGVKGRYFNGKATFLASLHDGHLVVQLDEAEVNGKPLSEQMMAGLRNENLAKNAVDDPKNAEFLNKLASLQIKDGKITIKAKPKAERGSGETQEATKKEEPSGDQLKKPDDPAQPPDETKAKEPPAEKPQEKGAPPEKDDKGVPPKTENKAA